MLPDRERYGNFADLKLQQVVLSMERSQHYPRQRPDCSQFAQQVLQKAADAVACALAIGLSGNALCIVPGYLFNCLAFCTSCCSRGRVGEGGNCFWGLR